MIDIVKQIKLLYARPTVETLALRELENARRDLLTAQTQQEYSVKMVEFYEIKIKRLSIFLKRKMSHD
jgi:hypothetical protein